MLAAVMPSVDFFVPSAEELCCLIDPPRYAEWTRRAQARGVDMTEALDPERDIRPLAERLLGWGAKVVLIKCGAPGIYLRTAGAQEMCTLGLDAAAWANTERFEPSYLVTEYRSGTGAGDVSLAAFLLAALEGYSPARSLQLATAAGACCVSTYDALSGLVPFPELLNRIEAGWPKRKR